MIRKAKKEDIAAIAETYRALLTHEQQFGSNSKRKLNVYPTIDVPINKVPTGTMYVLEDDGEICASTILNHEHAEEHSSIDWKYPGMGETVLVIHTLCIPPQKAGCGYGRQMVEYARTVAVKMKCTTIHIDTYAHNEPAKKLYLHNGFRIAGYGHILLQGLIDEEQVYLEYGVNYEKTGLIGGTGPESTIEYYKGIGCGVQRSVSFERNRYRQ